MSDTADGDARLRALAEDLRDFGVRFDLNPTTRLGPGEGEVALHQFYGDYLRRVDAEVRRRAREALEALAGPAAVDAGRAAGEASEIRPVRADGSLGDDVRGGGALDAAGRSEHCAACQSLLEVGPGGVFCPECTPGMA